MSIPKTINVLAFTDVQVLDVTGPLQVFASANDLAAARGLPPPYAVRMIAQGETVLCSAGLGLHAAPLPAVDSAADTLIVAGGAGVNAALGNADLLAWVREHAAHCRRVASVCSGAFLLAACGLLDGRRVATHWSRCAELAEKYPRLQVDNEPIFINDGQVWTSAGITAGIDLALALVEADLGRAIALAIARYLVVFLKRPGGQAQFSTALASQTDDDRFRELHAWIADNLKLELSVSQLADQAGMSERSFVRHYRAATGQTPARALELMRVESARRWLADTSEPIKRIAGHCGFGSEETMRRSFLRSIAVTPQHYRERFSR